MVQTWKENPIKIRKETLQPSVVNLAFVTSSRLPRARSRMPAKLGGSPGAPQHTVLSTAQMNLSGRCTVYMLASAKG